MRGLFALAFAVLALLWAVPAEAQQSLEEIRQQAGDVPWWQRATSFVGLFALVGVAWLMSSHRRRVPWRVVGWGIGLQLLFGVVVLKTDAGLGLFRFLNDVVVGLLDFTHEGTRFLFGDFVDEKVTFALNVLPIIIFLSSLMSVLYHLRVMQKAVEGIAWLMRRTMKTSGSETLSAAANIFVGQTEAPLVVKPFVSRMTRSELNAIMVGGFATVAGSVLAAYVGMLRESFPDIAGHLIAASVMSAPAALVIAKVMLPETEESDTAGATRLEVERPDVNVIEAAARGAAEGLKLALNVAAMLLAFLAFVALLNFLLGLPSEWYNSAVGAEVLLRGRRWQRAVPVVAPPPNRMRGFVETVGRLYHQHGDDRDLVEKKARYFLDRLRAALNESGLDFSEESRDRVARKAGVARADVDRLFDLFVRLRAASRIAADDLLDLDRRTDAFFRRLT